MFVEDLEKEAFDITETNIKSNNSNKDQTTFTLDTLTKSIGSKRTNTFNTPQSTVKMRKRLQQTYSQPVSMMYQYNINKQEMPKKR